MYTLGIKVKSEGSGDEQRGKMCKVEERGTFRSTTLLLSVFAKDNKLLFRLVSETSMFLQTCVGQFSFIRDMRPSLYGELYISRLSIKYNFIFAGLAQF